jgi:uncharacterized protein (DUF58 family)
MSEDPGPGAFPETVSFFSVWPVRLTAGIVLFFALVQMEFALALPAAGTLFIGFAADLWARFASSRLSFTLRSDRDRVFPGEDIGLVIELYNRKLLPVWLNLGLPLPPHFAHEAGTGGQGFLRSGLRLLSWEKSRRVVGLRARRRGVARPGPAWISAGDLLGLSSRTRSFEAALEIIVFPRRLRLRALSVPFQEYFGSHAARGPVEDPAWYAGTRDYTGTRPAKNIHWKASARLGTLQEKLYEPTLQRKLLFILDAGGWDEGGEEAEQAFGNFERMMETLGTLAGALMETGASFGLVTNALTENSFGGVLPAGRGPEHLGGFLEILARVAGPQTRRIGLEALLHGAAPAYAGFVYCASSPGERVLRVCREISGRKKIFCVFGRADTRDTPVWEGFPSCRMEDLCEDPE